VVVLPSANTMRTCTVRRRSGWGPRLIAGETGVAHSTVHAILRRHGCSRAPRAARREFVRYEWPCPGDLLHMDVKRYPRFRRPGHAMTGDRRDKSYAKLGHDYFHAIVDDRSRLAYGELLNDERAATTTAFVKRALAWFDAAGIATKRVMTDGAWNYTRNRSLRELFTRREIRHIVTPPYTPRWNGKVCVSGSRVPSEWAARLLALVGLTQAKGMSREIASFSAPSVLRVPFADPSGLRSIRRPARRERAGEGDLIGVFAPEQLHRHRSVPRRPSLDSIPEPGGHFDVRGHRRPQTHPRRRFDRRARRRGGHFNDRQQPAGL
jgi:hypothetical protein